MKNGLSGVRDFLESHPVDRLIGHVGHEVVVRVLREFDLFMSVIDGRRPLVRFAADEAVELVEAGAGRPAVGRPGGADLPGGGLVVLAEGGRAVAVEPQHLGQWRRRCWGVAPVWPGKAVAVSVIEPMLFMWWLRPVSRAARVGEQSAVV